MPTKVVLELPQFDTGQYERCEFLMSGGDATLTIHIAELGPVVIQFRRARWHQFTALYNCNAEIIRDAYFKLIEIVDSPALGAYVANDRASVKAYKELHHYQIFLDETGCHEVFAEVAATPNISLNPGASPAALARRPLGAG
jgi:hypothetical protein